MLIYDPELGIRVCDHAAAYVDPPCCAGSPDEAGRPTCDCQGRDSVVCPAPDCTGIQDYEIDPLLEKLKP